MPPCATFFQCTPKRSHTLTSCKVPLNPLSTDACKCQPDTGFGTGGATVGPYVVSRRKPPQVTTRSESHSAPRAGTSHRTRPTANPSQARRESRARRSQGLLGPPKWQGDTPGAAGTRPRAVPGPPGAAHQSSARVKVTAKVGRVGVSQGTCGHRQRERRGSPTLGCDLRLRSPRASRQRARRNKQFPKNPLSRRNMNFLEEPKQHFHP